jgi:hypothetical protein
VARAGKPKAERLRSAAVVKLKYLLTTGKLDSGFQFIFRGVLEDLQIEEAEVDAFIEAHRDELTQQCLAGG